MSVCTGIEHNPEHGKVGVFPLDQINDLSFRIGLEIAYVCIRKFIADFPERLGEFLRTVYLRLSASEKIQVWSVYNGNCNNPVN